MHALQGTKQGTRHLEKSHCMHDRYQNVGDCYNIICMHVVPALPQLETIQGRQHNIIMLWTEVAIQMLYTRH